ncbi:MAG: Unknown protein [uncultured Sulfurovum sp.]|uniref:DUF1835 domain-containing protein n=1 Tax=uncultured Sulfurovum sp. TaxID=269237 RepID=A0A6S6SCM0_9BACT|nr:MAG: Unknown protein [uncultured Sulfurovum sp.]
MIKKLNIVNGDTGIDIIKKAEIAGDFLPWRDFLHEGPVPAGLSLEVLSKIRAKFISDYGLGDFKTIKKEFRERNQKLNTYKLYQKVTLWFEHDLYDQLQLLQILEWFSKQDLEKTNLTLICTNNYLGESSPQQIKKLLQYETPILDEHLQLAQKAWSAFCSETPKKWAELLDEPTALLPFLDSAVYRMLQEYPSTTHGLSRTAHQALLIISNGINERVDIFTKYQSFEERKFMGDVIFWKILEEFKIHNVIEEKEERFNITPLGKKLLDGEKNWLSIATIQRSIGGVNLSQENLWCWDIKNKNIKKYYYSKSLESLLRVK